jgi:D-3-phosphoglycerate dehydrogenase
MSFKVLVPGTFDQKARAHLMEHGCEITEYSGSLGDVEARKRDIADCDVIVASMEKLPREVIEAAPRLKAVSCIGVGFDHVDVKAAEEWGAYVLHSPLANINSVAEHTMYLIMSCARNARQISEIFLSGGFHETRKYMATEVEGATLGIIGCGNIGRLVAKKASGMGMKVIGYDAYAKPGQAVENIAIAASKEEVFKPADFITVHMPLTPETRHSIGKALFDLMKPTAFFINAARGPIVVEADLLEALRAGKIRGAALDVFDPEPPKPDNPLLALSNVIATPHYAAASQKAWEAMPMHAAQSIVQVLEKKQPSWPVNRPSAQAHARRWQ